MQPEAIIFDLDGTLIDTEATWDEVRRGIAAAHGLDWPDGSTEAMMGMSTQEWAAHLVEVVGLPMTPHEAAEATLEAMADHHRQGVDVLPGAVEAVGAMATLAKVAIVSSSSRRLIDAAVERLGIGDLLAATVSTEEVAAGKPAPDGYLKAAGLMDVDPGRCIAVEDATNGVKSALAAGMQVIVVPPHFHPPAPELLARTRVIGTLHELTPQLVADL